MDSRFTWKTELAKLAATIGLECSVTVCHTPLGTSKWNKIVHRLFSFITMNWRAKSLTTYRTVVEIIAATTTTKIGLTVQADFDKRWYPTWVKVTDAELAAVPLKPHDFHPESLNLGPNLPILGRQRLYRGMRHSPNLVSSPISCPRRA